MEETKDRIALIAGVPDDLCGAIGSRLANGGTKVVLAGSDKSKIEAAASIIKKNGGTATELIGNMTNANDVKNIVSEVIKKFGEINILINNSDDPSASGIADLEYDDWRKSLSNNLDSMFLFSREIISGMRQKKFGRVINMQSIDYLGWPGKVNYSAAKSAIFGFTRSLALETAKDNITVNTLVKGDIAYTGITEEEAARLADQLPVKRLGTPKDVAYAVAFLASDAANYITGQTLFVCGGKSIHYSMSI